jgi:hypothetical protein
MLSNVAKHQDQIQYDNKKDTTGDFEKKIGKRAS